MNAERYVQLPSWLACLPMASAGGLDADLERMGRMKTLLTSSAVNLAPPHGEWRGHRSRLCATGAREEWTLDCEGNGAPERADRPRLAVLIDGENASPCHARAVFEAAEGFGDAMVRRIYGDFSNGRLASWNAPIRKFATVLCQQLAHVRGKNAADIALAIDAVDLSYQVRLDGFLLVSSDSDFTRLAQRLREGGFAVFGFGESRTPRALRAACHRFEIVGRAANDAVGAPGRDA